MAEALGTQLPESGDLSPVHPEDVLLILSFFLAETAGEHSLATHSRLRPKLSCTRALAEQQVSTFMSLVLGRHIGGETAPSGKWTDASCQAQQTGGLRPQYSTRKRSWCAMRQLRVPAADVPCMHTYGRQQCMYVTLRGALCCVAIHRCACEESQGRVLRSGCHGAWQGPGGQRAARTPRSTETDRQARQRAPAREYTMHNTHKHTYTHTHTQRNTNSRQSVNIIDKYD